jgi:undecaprenyl-diphosphatase
MTGDGLAEAKAGRTDFPSGIVEGVRNPPLIPQRFRRIALLTAVLGWLVAVVLGVRYAGGTYPGWLDDAGFHLMRSLVGNPVPVGKWAVAPPTVPTRVLAAFSSPVLTYGMAVVTLGYAIWRRWWALAGLAVLAPAVCVLVTEVLAKPLIDRRHEGYLSYPSGHTVTSVAALTVLVLAFSAGWSRRNRLVAGAVWLVFVVCVAAGLVAMNYHYPTDTIGGIGVALGVTLPGALVADLIRRTGGRGTARPAGTAPAGTSSDIPRPTSPR